MNKKYLLTTTIIILTLFANQVSADFINDATSYFNFEQTGTDNLTDLVDGDTNSTFDLGWVKGSAGIIGSSWCNSTWQGTQVIKLPASDIIFTGAWTHSFWVKDFTNNYSNSAATYYTIGDAAGGARKRAGLWSGTAPAKYYAIDSVGTGDMPDTARKQAFYMITVTYDGSNNLSYYENKTFKYSYPVGSLVLENDNGINIGAASFWVVNKSFDACFDEMKLFNRSLTIGEITAIYDNETTGVYYPYDFVINATTSVTLNSPSNATFFEDNLPTFNASCTYIGWANLSFYVNYTFVGSNASFGTGENVAVTPTIQVPFFNKYNWWANCSNDASSRISNNRTFYYANTSGCTGTSAPSSDSGYYFSSSSGSDSNSGTSTSPYQTIAKFNTLSLTPGTNAYFKCGDVWRFPNDAYIDIDTHDGNSTHPITIASYGSCNGTNKPLFLGAITANSTSNWTDDGDNIWNFTLTEEVANVLYNGDTIVGGYESHNTTADLDVQGEFYWNATKDKLQVYSTDNPATFYDNIEIVLNRSIFFLNGEDYFVFANLSMKYGHAGVELNGGTDFIKILGNDISWMGGNWDDGVTPQVRFGDCISAGQDSDDTLIAYNNVSNCADAGITAQTWTANNNVNTNISYNTIKNSNYGIVLFGSLAPLHNTIVDHNTIINSKKGYTQWSNVAGARAIRIGSWNITAENLTITNNIFYNYSTLAIDIGDDTTTRYKGEKALIDYNLYGGGTTYIVNNATTEYTNTTAFCLGDEQECNGALADPQLSGFQPLSTSPACTMSDTTSFVGALDCASADEPSGTCSAPAGILVSSNCQIYQNGAGALWLIS